MEMSFAVGLVTIPVILFAFLLPIALLVALQVWLCKKSVYLGLVLPGISLVMSLLMTLLLAFNLVGAAPGNLVIMGIIFLVTNIPTIVFGGIWLHCKGRKETLDGLNRMRIEDLE